MPFIDNPGQPADLTRISDQLSELNRWLELITGILAIMAMDNSSLPLPARNNDPHFQMCETIANEVADTL